MKKNKGLKEKKSVFLDSSDLKANIVKLLNKNTYMTTRQLQIATQRAWHTVLTACQNLQIDGTVEHDRISNLHRWSLKKKKSR